MSTRRNTPAARSFPSRAGEESGFTMIEVLVASVLLIIGVFATLALLDNGAKATSGSLQRDTGNALALEVIERAQGMRYSTTMNDLTDVRPGTATPTPADRLRGALDPTPPTPASGRRSTDPMVKGAAVPTPIANATTPWSTTAEWHVTRRNTDYTVTFRSCTRSDVIQGLQVLGPFDCDRPNSTVTPPTGTQTSGDCSLSILNAAAAKQQFADGVKAQDIAVQVLLLNTLGVNACVNGVLGALNLSALTGPLCNVLGDGTNALGTVAGLLNSVLGPLASGLSLSVCPRSGAAPPPAVASAIGSSTEVQTTVSWKDRATNSNPVIVQRAVIRRGGTS